MIGFGYGYFQRRSTGSSWRGSRRVPARQRQGQVRRARSAQACPAATVWSSRGAWPARAHVDRPRQVRCRAAVSAGRAAATAAIVVSSAPAAAANLCACSAVAAVGRAPFDDAAGCTHFCAAAVSAAAVSFGLAVRDVPWPLGSRASARAWPDGRSACVCSYSRVGPTFDRSSTAAADVGRVQQLAHSYRCGREA